MRISDWSSDVCSSDLQDVADRAVRRLPHLLEAEFLDPRLVGGDRRAFDADAMLLDRVRGIDGDLVVGAVAFLDAEVVIMQVDVEIGKDQAFANPLPDDPRSEEQPYEIQSLMRISYAVFCLK